MPIAENFTSIHSCNWEINFLQCLPNGFLKHTELCNLLQLTAAEHAEKGGLSFTDMQEFDQAWVLSRMRVEIDALPKWRDTVTVTTWIMDLQGSRSVRALEMSINGKKIVGAITYWAVFNTKARKSEALAPKHEHFIKYPEKHATRESFHKLITENNMQEIVQKKILLSDLDIVNHANNVKYLEWCMDCIDYKSIINKKMASFDMNFLRELQWNDTVSILKKDTTAESIFSVTKENKPCFLLKLNWE